MALSFATQSAADRLSDARYIVSQTVTKEIFEGALVAQRPLIIGALENELRQSGITLSDTQRFFDLFMEEFIDEFTETMQEESTSINLNAFSDQELADIAAFMRSPSGQAFVLATPTVMAEGARIGQIAGTEAGRNAGPRVAERLRTEGITMTQDEGMMDRLLDFLK
ncbi:MAG: DUF2059 domain-containing protein [Pseudomonadota bacterium]